MNYNCFGTNITINPQVDEYIELYHDLANIQRNGIIQLKNTKLPKGKNILPAFEYMVCTPVYKGLQRTIQSLSNLGFNLTCEDIIDSFSPKFGIFFEVINTYEKKCLELIEDIVDSDTIQDIYTILCDRDTIGKNNSWGTFQGLTVLPINNSFFSPGDSIYHSFDRDTRLEIDQLIYTFTLNSIKIFTKYEAIESAFAALDEVFIEICNSINPVKLVPYSLNHWNYELKGHLIPSSDFNANKDVYISLLKNRPYCPVVYMDILSLHNESKNDAGLLELADKYDVSIPTIIQSLKI